MVIGMGMGWEWEWKWKWELKCEEHFMFHRNLNHPKTCNSAALFATECIKNTNHKKTLFE
jgi:hypothetical protein